MAKNPDKGSKTKKEGWLEKQSRYLRKWRKRYVVLEGSTLYSFKDKHKKKESATEIIDLKIFSSVKSSEDTTHRAFSFDIYSSNQNTFSFVAKTESDKEDWIRYIGKAIVLSNQKATHEKDYEYGDNNSDDDDNDE